MGSDPDKNDLTDGIQNLFWYQPTQSQPNLTNLVVLQLGAGVWSGALDI